MFGPWPVTVARFGAPFGARRILLKITLAYPQCDFFFLIKCFGKGGVQYCFGEKARFGARQHVQKTMINHIIGLYNFIYIYRRIKI